MSIVRTGLALSICITLFSCSKGSGPNNSVTPVDTTSHVNPADSSVSGAVYAIADSRMKKITVQTSTLDWERLLTSTLFGTYPPFNYDSNLVYFGNYSSLTAYNNSTASVAWTFGWAAFSDIYGYRLRPQFKDSLVFFNSSTSAYAGASIYCLQRFTGAVKWSKIIDDGGWIFYGFAATPMVFNDKLITLSRDDNGHKRLICFNISNGQTNWTSALNDELKDDLKLYNGKIYSTSNQYAYCYDAATGALLWQTDMQFPAVGNSFDFIDNNALIVARNFNNLTNTVKTFNTTTGALLSSNTVNLPATVTVGFLYRNSKIYIVNVLTDTLEVQAFNLNNLSYQWKYDFTSFNTRFTILPLLTDKYLVLEGEIKIPGDINSTQAKVIFLNMDGTQRKQAIYPSVSTRRFIYVENEKTFLQEDY